MENQIEMPPFFFFFCIRYNPTRNPYALARAFLGFLSFLVPKGEKLILFMDTRRYYWCTRVVIGWKTIHQHRTRGCVCFGGLEKRNIHGVYLFSSGQIVIFETLGKKAKFARPKNISMESGRAGGPPARFPPGKP